MMSSWKSRQKICDCERKYYRPTAGQKRAYPSRNSASILSLEMLFTRTCVFERSRPATGTMLLNLFLVTGLLILCPQIGKAQAAPAIGPGQACPVKVAYFVDSYQSDGRPI